MKIFIKLGFLVFTFLGFNAFAEGNCPAGYYQVGGGNSGYQGCAPIPSGPATNNQDIVGQLRGMGPSRPKWLHSYGSLALGKDKDNGQTMYALVFKARSEYEAMSKVLSDCESAGLLECKGVFVFANGYIALSSGEDGKIYWGANKKEKGAKKIAIEECEKKTTKCEVFKTADSSADRNY